MDRAKRDVIELIESHLLSQPKGAYYTSKVRLIRDNIAKMDLKNGNSTEVKGLQETKS